MVIDYKLDFKDDKLNKLYQDLLDKRKVYDKVAEDKIKTSLSRLNSIFEEYKPNCKSIYKKAIKQAYKKEYAIKGEYLHRGYYCPSPIADIIVGNAPRGKLLKRVTSRSKPTYEYEFNKQGEIVIARNLCRDTLESQNIEIILHKDRCHIGILFYLDKNEYITIESINESVYDKSNRITSFAKGIIYNSKIQEAECEIYSYNEFGLKTVECYSWIGNSYTGDKYTFEHDIEGNLSEYICEPSMFPDEKYKVNIKRKV